MSMLVYRAGRVAAFGFAGLALVQTFPASACATCGCTLSSDAAMGYSALAGWRINFDYTFINQNQLRNGYGAVSPAQAAAINDAGGDQEVERQTINRYFNLGISYSPDAEWAFNLQLPFVDRSHTTYDDAGAADLTPANISGATASGLGDIKLIANYQGFLPTHNLGVQLGVKLPTGHYGGGPDNNGAVVGHRPAHFSSGPNAGDLLDTSLNAGTGSTDLIVGAYYYQAVSQDFDVFVNGQLQAAMAERLDHSGSGGDYRPGNAELLSFGVRYEAHPAWVPQLQVNLSHKSADQGTLADTADSEGTVAYISPGITLRLLPQLHAYSFVQVPVFSKLDGYQLFPHWTGTVGLSYSF